VKVSASTPRRTPRTVGTAGTPAPGARSAVMANASAHVHLDSRVIRQPANPVAPPEPRAAMVAAAVGRSAATTSVWTRAQQENLAILRRASAAVRPEPRAAMVAAATPRPAAMDNVSTPAHLVSISTLGRANARRVSQANPVVPTAAPRTRSVAPIRSRACPAAIRMGTAAAGFPAAACAAANTNSAVGRRICPSTVSRHPAIRANHVGWGEGAWSGANTEQPILTFCASSM
jgi:hypothetical protein